MLMPGPSLRMALALTPSVGIDANRRKDEQTDTKIAT